MAPDTRASRVRPSSSPPGEKHLTLPRGPWTYDTSETSREDVPRIPDTGLGPKGNMNACSPPAAEGHGGGPQAAPSGTETLPAPCAQTGSHLRGHSRRQGLGAASRAEERGAAAGSRTQVPSLASHGVSASAGTPLSGASRRGRGPCDPWGGHFPISLYRAWLSHDAPRPGRWPQGTAGLGKTRGVSQREMRTRDRGCGTEGSDWASPGSSQVPGGSAGQRVIGPPPDPGEQGEDCPVCRGGHGSPWTELLTPGRIARGSEGVEAASSRPGRPTFRPAQPPPSDRTAPGRGPAVPGQSRSGL